MSQKSHNLALTSASFVIVSIFSIVLGTISGLLVIHTLSPENYGEFSYFLDTLAIARFLANLGVGVKIIHDVAHHRSDTDEHKVSLVITNMFFVRLGSVSTVFTALFLLGLFQQDVALQWAAATAVITSLLDFSSALTSR